MHELAITQSIVDAVCEHCDGRRVTAVRLKVGRLSGVLPDAVRFCFDLVTAGTCVEGAALVVDEPPGRGVCRGCGREQDLTELIAMCPCGSVDVEVLAGRELTVQSYEVV